MKKATLTIPLVIAVILACWYFPLHLPAQTRIKTLESRVSAEEEKLTAYREALSKLDASLKEHDQLRTGILRFGASISGTDEVVAIYQLLDSLCHGKGYHLDEIAPSLEEVIRFLQEWHSSGSSASVPIRIRIRGEYRSLADLIETIEGSRFFDRLISCWMTGSEELYPDCYLELAFFADLRNRPGVINLE